MKCFYHSADLDGQCSGAIVKHFYPECELIGINYGRPFPWDAIEKNEPVFMVDFSLQPFEDMIRLANLATLVWIDHHKTAIDESVARHIEKAISGLREVGRAGCELTWEYIQEFVMRDKPEKAPVPLAVHLLGRYDVWDLKNPQVLAFQYGMRTYNTDPNDQGFWGRFFEPDEFPGWEVDGIIWKGEAILEYEAQSNAKYMAAAAFPVLFDGLKCLAVNKLLSNSKLFESAWDRNKYDAMLAFGYRGKGWTVSLYSDREDVDVGEVCKRRGGGGHKGAAGFQCDVLPFRVSPIYETDLALGRKFPASFGVN